MEDEFYYASLSSEYEELKLDNKILHQHDDVSYYNSHLLYPSLSNEIYSPGKKGGYIVYGISGPKILVSHPFRSINSQTEMYDIYHDSGEIVKSLWSRGYFGRFLFLDYLGGLNFSIDSIPAWVIWFSFIASQSDLVLFIKLDEMEFGNSQQLEVGFTPDRVQKKVVGIPQDELKYSTDEIFKKDYGLILYRGEKGLGITKEEWYDREMQQSKPFIDLYLDPAQPPNDRLVRIDKDGSINEYPINYPLYTF